MLLAAALAGIKNCDMLLR